MKVNDPHKRIERLTRVRVANARNSGCLSISLRCRKEMALWLCVQQAREFYHRMRELVIVSPRK